MRVRAIIVSLALVCGPVLAAETITIAVASNFSRPAAALAAEFTGTTGVIVRISNGSTGKLYAQIVNGAPFDVFLAADTERPMLLEESGHAVAASRFTYAQGALVLWSRDAPDCLAVLADESSGRIALANPKTAPYGMAAVEFLDAEGGWEAVSARAVYGENINQTLQFLATGNAIVGFIAKSQLGAPQLPEPGCVWEVPVSSHTVIEQQAVLLAHSASNRNARLFVEYLRSDDAREIIGRHGYNWSQ